MWNPIETAPNDRRIIVRDKWKNTEIVQKSTIKSFRGPEKIVWDTGFSCADYGNYYFDDPIEWCEVPE